MTKIRYPAGEIVKTITEKACGCEKIVEYPKCEEQNYTYDEVHVCHFHQNLCSTKKSKSGETMKKMTFQTILNFSIEKNNYQVFILNKIRQHRLTN